MILIGQLCLWIALLMAAWASIVPLAAGAMQRSDLAASGRRAIYVAAASLACANAGVLTALLTRDFSFAYVARHTSLDLPAPYVASALWSGTAGSLLVWALAVAVLGGAAVLTGHRRRAGGNAWVAGVVGLLLLSALLTVCFAHDPYARLGWLAGDGLGLDPVLRHAEMVLARPAALVGLATVAVGAAVIAGDRVSRAGAALPVGRVRAWLLPGWTLLSLGLGLSLRGWYAYSPAGGIWRWTPFATVTLGAWVATSAVLHLHGVRGGRRLAAHTAHLGIVVLVVGLVGGAFATSQRRQLRTGQELRAIDPMGHQWRFVSQGVSRYGTPDHDVTAVTLESWRDDLSRGLIVSQRLDYHTAQGDRMPVPQPALRTAGLVDLRVAIDSTADDLAGVQLTFVPVAGLRWWGAALLVLGGLLGMLPARARAAANQGRGRGQS